MGENKTPTLATQKDLKNKKHLKIGVVFGSVVIMALVLAKIMGPSKPMIPQAPPPPDKKVIRDAYDITSKTPEDKWIAESENRFAQMEKQNIDLQDQLNKVISQTNQNNTNKTPQQNLVNMVAANPSPKTTPNGSIFPGSTLPPEKDFPAFEKGAPNVVPGINGATPAVFVNNDSGGIRVISNEITAPATGANFFGQKVPNNAVLDNEKKEEKTINEWMPTGSFMPGILLSGLDAPTGGQAQSNPHPVLIRVKDMAVLPNRFREDVKECFIVGAGYGDISSERAYIRTETLSCVLKNEKVMDIKVKGFIAGEDGKNGMRGRLVSKEGQMIAKALLAGFASGIGSAFQANSMTQSISPLGTTQTVNASMVGQAAVAGGVTSAANLIANHYIKMAEQTFPIIEVDAGRQIDVVITQGFEIHLDQTEQIEKENK
jgi:conjugal transfer pilus assembly protein TraB